MAITEQLRSVARFEYGVLRSALSTVDRAVLTPLADRSPGLERVVTRARDAVSDLSGRFAPAGAPQAPASAPRADAPVEVPVERAEAKPRPKPESKPESKVETVAADAGSAVLDADEVVEAEELAGKTLEADAVHVTGELAENEDLREVQARLRAKHTLQEQDEQHR